MSTIIFLQQFETPFLSSFFKFITFFGDAYFFAILVCILYICCNKKFVFSFTTSFLATVSFNQLLKLTFKIERPYLTNPNVKPIITASGYSFPSGHSASISALASMGIAKNKSKIVVYILLILSAILVAVSRMYLGVHTLLDVSVGLIIGSVISLFLYHFLNSIKKQEWLALAISICAFLVSFVFVKSFLSFDSKIISVLQISGAICGFYLGYFLERKFVCFDIEKLPIKKRIIVSIIQLVCFVPVLLLFIFFKSNALIWFFRMLFLTLYLTFVQSLIVKLILKKFK